MGGRRKRSTSRATYHHGALKEALLTRALEVVCEAGHEALSLRTCARDLGVDVAAVYRHFASRRALLASVSARAQLQLASAMTTAMAAVGRRPEHSVAYLQACGRAYLDFGRAHPYLYQFVFGGTISPSEVREARALLAESSPSLPKSPYDLLADALDLLVEAVPERRPLRPGAELLVWSMVHGVVSLRIAGRAGEELSNEELVQQIGAWILRALTPRGPVGP